MEYMIMFFVFVLVCVFIWALINVPVYIANARGICGTNRTIIIVLSWLGILLGVTWVAALVLSLVWPAGDGADASCNDCASQLDALERAAKLYRARVISKAEYEKMRKKIMSNK